MTIDESTRQLGTLDLDDLDAASKAVSARGRAVVEFAAAADPQSLLVASAAGQLLIERLLTERRRLLAEVSNARSLHDSLVCNVSDGTRPQSLLGSTLLG
jgi:hypothetical protein